MQSDPRTLRRHASLMVRVILRGRAYTRAGFDVMKRAVFVTCGTSPRDGNVVRCPNPAPMARARARAIRARPPVPSRPPRSHDRAW